MKVLALSFTFILTMGVMHGFTQEESNYVGTGIVREIKDGKLVIYVKSDDCYGLHELPLTRGVEVRGVKGLIIFEATGNPCKSGDVQIIGVRKPTDEREQK